MACRSAMVVSPCPRRLFDVSSLIVSMGLPRTAPALSMLSTAEKSRFDADSPAAGALAATTGRQPITHTTSTRHTANQAVRGDADAWVEVLRLATLTLLSFGIQTLRASRTFVRHRVQLRLRNSHDVSIGAANI